MDISEVQVGDRVWFHHRFDSKGNSCDGIAYLHEGVVVSKFSKTLVADSEKAGRQFSFELDMVRGLQPTKPPPEPKPPTHHEIEQANMDGFRSGMFWGAAAVFLAAALMCGAFVCLGSWLGEIP